MTPQEIEALKAERDALAAQNKILLGALNLALPSVETCYKQHMATWETLFLLREAAKAAPQQCLRDARAEAGRKGFIDGAEYFIDPDKVNLASVAAAADLYAESVQQGGCE